MIIVVMVVDGTLKNAFSKVYTQRAHYRQLKLTESYTHVLTLAISLSPSSTFVRSLHA